MTAHLRVVEPCNENRSVAPGRQSNADLRPREYLTVAEVERLIKAAKDSRHGHRDATMILMTWTFGMACGRSRFAASNGLRSNLAAMPRCTSVERRTASRPFTPFGGMSCGHCASCKATPRRLSFRPGTHWHENFFLGPIRYGLAAPGGGGAGFAADVPASRLHRR
jgi:hypothetical protein